MDEELMRALEADGEKLRAMTGEDHGPVFVADAAHTPGPWFIDRDGIDFGTSTEYHVIEGGKGFLDPGDGMGFRVSGCMSLADARLMAAAPDLLDALRMLVADFGDYPASARPCLAFDRAHAAIAKATGEDAE